MLRNAVGEPKAGFSGFMLSWEVARRFYLPLRAKRRLWRLHSHSWLHRCKQLRPPGRLRWAEVCTPAHREEICTWSQWKAAALPCTRKFWAAVCRLSRRRSGQACQTAQWWAGAPAESGAAPELGVNENQRLWESAKTREDMWKPTFICGQGWGSQKPNFGIVMALLASEYENILYAKKEENIWNLVLK